MSRVKTFVNTGIAPDGRLYAGDLNALQDHYADKSDFTQTVDVSSIRIGDPSLQILKYGTGEIRISAAVRTDGIMRGLGGVMAGAFTTAQRDAIVAPPTGLLIFNQDQGRFEFNFGTTVAPVWRSMGDPVVGVDTTRPPPGVVGRRYWDSTNKIEWIDTGLKWIPNDGLHTGAEMDYSGPVSGLGGIVLVKPAWLLQNGATLPRTAPYNDLFNEIGTSYGAPDGSSFSLPNALGRVTVPQNGATFAGRGQYGGEESHALTAAEVPAHDPHWHDLIGNITPAQGAGDPFSTVKPAVSQAGPTPGAGHNNIQPYAVTGARLIRFL